MKTIMKNLVPILLLTVCAMLPAKSGAVDEGPLTSVIKAYLVTQDAGGEETLVETNKVYPAQTVQYKLIYTNTSDAPLQGLKLIGPIPDNTVYLADSAEAGQDLTPQFSIDAGMTFGPEPLVYIFTRPDGGREERVATPDMYTHVRWLIDTLAPAESRTLRYRVLVK
jgi:uncharacterized repeat protein (TIGR01451 family)